MLDSVLLPALRDLIETRRFRLELSGPFQRPLPHLRLQPKRVRLGRRLLEFLRP